MDDASSHIGSALFSRVEKQDRRLPIALLSGDMIKRLCRQYILILIILSEYYSLSITMDVTADDRTEETDTYCTLDDETIS